VQTNVDVEFVQLASHLVIITADDGLHDADDLVEPTAKFEGEVFLIELASLALVFAENFISVTTENGFLTSLV
jgi:hypothetical protein